MKQKYLQENETGYTPRLLMEEASRCLLCHDAPCSKSCPAGTDPAKFIRSVRFQNIKGAAETIRINNLFGAVCARVCPTERYCQYGCSRSGIDKPIDIARIQRYVTDFEDANKMKILEKAPRVNKKVAIIGAGPAGLSAAGELALKGVDVTVYEKESEAGGYLRYGIPSYRLPTQVVDKEIKRIVSLGVKVVTNHEVKDLEKLKKEYDAVIMAIGFGEGKTLDMFKNNPHVELATAFLKRVKERKGDVSLPDRALVIGGGDVAMDVVTTLKKLGVRYVNDVVYETFAEFKASKKELQNAREEGVSIMDGYIPTKCQEDEVTFHHRFLDAEIRIKSPLIILAIGQKIHVGSLGVDVTAAGEVNPRNGKVFACGDIARGNDKTVVYSVRSGKEVSTKVAQYLGVK